MDIQSTCPESIPGDATLPRVPVEGPAPRRAFIIRQVRSVYADIVCETAELERALDAPLRTPGAVAALAFKLIGLETQEVFGAFLLNGKHKVAGFAEVSRGTLTASLVHPREVFACAIRELAAAVIVVHNHPPRCRSPPSVPDSCLLPVLTVTSEKLPTPVEVTKPKPIKASQGALQALP